MTWGFLISDVLAAKFALQIWIILAASGIRFTQLYNSSRCCPTRASLLTGLSPHQAGIGHMVDDWGIGPAYQGWLREDTTTIAEALKTNGYRTCYSGKWHANWSFEADPDQAPDTHHKKLGSKGYPHPLQRGFDESYALMAGATSLFNPQHLLKQDQWIEPDQPGYYITDAITDEAIKMIGTVEESHQPFFLHLSHIAPHWPLHALPEDIEKYKNHYQIGWDKLRQARHQKLQQLGLIDTNWDCSVRDEYAPPWDSLSTAQQQWEASRMAVYAAMIDRMDQSIGRLITHLKTINQYENTLIMFLSDNGGCAEFLKEDGWCRWYGHPTWDGRPMRSGNLISIEPGADDTFMSYDLPWANASNTPFRLFKHYVHEGGISTPVVVSWPQVITTEQICHTPCHVQDILPTILDLTGTECPTSRNEVRLQAPEGESFLPVIRNQLANQPDGQSWSRRKPICFEHEGNAAIRKDQWKAVRKYPDDWELYNMDQDRTEQNNLAKSCPEKLSELMQAYQEWALHCGVKDWPPGPWPEWMNTDEFRGEETKENSPS